MNFFYKPSFKELAIVILIITFSTLFLYILNSQSSAKSFVAVAPTPSPTQTYPECQDHNSNYWHPAAKKDSSGKVICIYKHEHGDPPPRWLTDKGIQLGFNHESGFMANTSSYENSQKHQGMKGFSANIKGVEVYARIHLASNPLDRASRYHSYELYLKDQAGGISHFQGWLDSGNPISDRIAYRDSTAPNLGKDPGTRPIIWASSRHACQIDQVWCAELWDMKTSSWGPDIIWGINDATTFYQRGEDTAINNWDESSSVGTDRSLTVTLYRDPEQLEKRGVHKAPEGEVWATQFGDFVSGPQDPVCAQTSLKYGTSYQNICLENYIAPTLPQITGVGNTVQKNFDSTGVRVPN